MVDTFILTDALAALPQAPKVEYSLWVPKPQTLPGHVQGDWGPWIALAPGPYTISKPTDETQRTSAGGYLYLLALSVYCPAGIPIELAGAPAGPPRTARVRYNGDPYVYKVEEVRTWMPVSNHAEIHCGRFTGESKGSPK